MTVQAYRLPRSRVVLGTAGRELFALSIGIATAAGPAYGQVGDLWSVETSGIRVVFPTREAVDTAYAQRLASIALDQLPLPGGLPDFWSTGGRVTISLAVRATPGLTAWSSAQRRLIVIPLAESQTWNEPTASRILRHELAHLALESYLGLQRLPLWFREGFAEWVAGGLTCEGVARVRLHIIVNSSDQVTYRVDEKLATSRLAYDLYTTAFDYLLHLTKDALLDGTFMARVRRSGFANTLHSFDLTEDILEGTWSEYWKRRDQEADELCVV